MKKIKTNTYYYLIAAVVLLIILLLLSRKKVFSNNKPTNPNTGNNYDNVNDEFPLKLGSEGSNVENLQTILIRAGYNMQPYGVDGVFGNKTLEAVRLVFGKDTVDFEDMVNYVTNSFGWSHLFW
jgi:hypothetical protein